MALHTTAIVAALGTVFAIATNADSQADQKTISPTKQAAATTVAQLVRVPFVPCDSDGQVGPIRGPKDNGKAPSVPDWAAPNLAYYATSEMGVLAPRGWHCFGMYGSAGATLTVTPEPHRADEFFNEKFGLSGPAVQLSWISTDTSGRFEAARVVARLFPAKRDFVQRVIQEGLEPASGQNLTVESD
jgi:hypothetical protein